MVHFFYTCFLTSHSAIHSPGIVLSVPFYMPARPAYNAPRIVLYCRMVQSTISICEAPYSPNLEPYKGCQFYCLAVSAYTGILCERLYD